MADWSLLFIESCVLLSMAVLVKSAEPFSYCVVGLLLLDTIWAFAAHLAFSPGSQKHPGERKWAIINIITSILLVTSVGVRSCRAVAQIIVAYILL